MQHVYFVALLFTAALVLALLEVEIEGEAGWASGLPTWRIENRWTRRLIGRRAITGYHVYFHLLVLLLAHAPYGLGLVEATLATELRILGFIVLLWVLEDFLWFAVNPGYGLRAFTRDRIWWHAPNWWWFMPRDYWLFAPIGVAFYLLSWHV